MDKFLFFYCRCKTSPAALQFAINLCYNKLIMHREPAVTRRLAAGPDLSGRDRLRCLPHCGGLHIPYYAAAPLPVRRERKLLYDQDRPLHPVRGFCLPGP